MPVESVTTPKRIHLVYQNLAKNAKEKTNKTIEFPVERRKKVVNSEKQHTENQSDAASRKRATAGICLSVRQ